MNDPKDHLALTLKETRAVLKLSLDKVSKITGVSKAMLGQIERGESSPTVATLWKIATGLGVSLSSFIEPSPPRNQKTLVRTADEIRQHPANDGLEVAPLFPFDEQVGFEYFELSFNSGYERISEPHAKGVMEFVSVTQGKMDMWVDGQWQTLETGQSMRFAGDREHGYRNPYPEKCVTITVIHYPNKPDH